MSRFLKVFLRDPLSGRIHIAGFGKHPAWDDHIDDIGLATETLVLTKQLLYSEGIATQLASGAWDQIEKSGQAIEFDHRFVWGRDEQAIIGAIWASADRKGRTRFPMVICIQAGFDGLKAIGLLLAPIERLGMLCREAKTQEKIRDSFNQTYRELNGAIPRRRQPFLGNQRSRREFHSAGLNHSRRGAEKPAPAHLRGDWQNRAVTFPADDDFFSGERKS